MGNQFNNQVQVRISKDQKTLIIEKNGVPAFISVGLIKYMLNIPYTRKDGTAISEEMIRAMKARNTTKLDRAGSTPVSRPRNVSRA